MPVTKMSILEGVHYIATYLQHFLQDTPISSHFFFRYPNPIVISELTEQDGKTPVCDKHDRAIICVFCRDHHLTLRFPVLLQTHQFKER